MKRLLSPSLVVTRRRAPNLAWKEPPLSRSPTCVTNCALKKNWSSPSARNFAPIQIAELVKALPNAKFICLGDYANSRGASDMGLYPDLLPGYVPVGKGAAGEWMADAPAQPGLNTQEMFAAAKDGKLKAMYVVGSNPVARLRLDPFALHNTFLVVQDMFLTETAMLADVVLPPANAYEKSGTMTNTCGDIQILKKAGDVSTVKNDFEIIVRHRRSHGVRRPQTGSVRQAFTRRHGPNSWSAIR